MFLCFINTYVSNKYLLLFDIILCVSEEYMSQKICRRNVLNTLSAKSLSANCPVGEMSVSEMSSTTSVKRMYYKVKCEVSVEKPHRMRATRLSDLTAYYLARASTEV